MSSFASLDPYKTLGISKDATLAEIRGAHRRLVLKCHPDKVQDPSLMASKQDEFQRVQEAYEILSDETRRKEYDNRIRLMELRKQMAKGNTTTNNGSNFEYEVKTETKASHYKSNVKVVDPHTTVFEEIFVELHNKGERKNSTKKTANPESERKRSSNKDSASKKDAHPKKSGPSEEKKEKLRQMEKEAKREKLRSKEKREKEREKERRRESEEKRPRKPEQPIFEESEDDYPPPPPRRAEKSSHSRQKANHDSNPREETSTRAHPDATYRQPPAEEKPDRPKEMPMMDDKWSEHIAFAGKYVRAVKENGGLPGTVHTPPPVRRAEPYAVPTSSPYNVRYSQAPGPQYSDEESRRRSSRHHERHTSSDLPSGRRMRTNDPNPSASHRRESRDSFPTPSTPLSGRKPSLKTYTSVPLRETSSASKAQEYSRSSRAMPSLSRAQTYSEPRTRHKKVEIYSESETDYPPTYRKTTKTSYTVDNGRTTTSKTSRRRSEHRTEHTPVDPMYPGPGVSSHPRPPPMRNPPVNEYPSFVRSYPIPEYPTVPEPSVRPVYPRVAPRVAPRTSTDHGIHFGNVSYTPTYGRENVVFANHSTHVNPDYGRSSHYAPRDGKRDGVYAA